MDFSSDHSRWQAVRLRSQSAHASFVYAVTTTHIYCRPTCPSRLARRSNVVFFDSAAAAATAGFRACKRCKPDCDPASLENRQLEKVRRAREILEQTQGSTTTSDIAKRVGLSPRYFHEVFKRATGCTPAQYAKRHGREGNQDGNAVGLGPSDAPNADPFWWSRLCLTQPQSDASPPLPVVQQPPAVTPECLRTAQSVSFLDNVSFGPEIDLSLFNEIGPSFFDNAATLGDADWLAHCSG